MRIWQVEYPGALHYEGELGVEWVATKREAARLAREGDGDYRQFDVPTKKAELIAFLNRECS